MKINYVLLRRTRIYIYVWSMKTKKKKRKELSRQVIIIYKLDLIKYIALIKYKLHLKLIVRDNQCTLERDTTFSSRTMISIVSEKNPVKSRVSPSLVMRIRLRFH